MVYLLDNPYAEVVYLQLFTLNSYRYGNETFELQF